MNTYQSTDAIALVHSGADFFDRLVKLVDAAQHSVHLQTYIFEADETGTSVAEALRRAAARGVQVRLMADGFGSKNLPPDFIRDLQAGGVEFRFFQPIVSLWRWQFGRTLHHKVAVADSREALVGGINVADKYRGTAEEPAWLDFAVYIRGAGVCGQLQELCEGIFQHAYWRRRRRAGTVSNQPENPAGLLRLRQNDWLRGKSEIYQSYRTGIVGARRSLVLVASYFLPGRALRRHLRAASRRGVAVRVLLTGPSDVWLSRLAEQYLTWWLLRRGIRVFRWEHSVLHGKAILADERWASLGSYNINRLSRIRSVELNVDVLDPSFIRRFADYLDDLLVHHCVEITSPDLPGWWERLKTRAAYHVAVYLMRVLFPKRR